MGASWSISSYVFTTFCGCRPAEPCSLTVAATHQLLTQVLLYLMYAVRYYEPDLPKICGSSFKAEEVCELEALNLNTLDNLQRLGRANDPTRKELLKQGDLWAQHILEGPIAWILSATYIAITVTIGYTPLSAIVLTIIYGITGTWGFGDTLFDVGGDPHYDPIKYVVGFLDAIIYTFLPWWMTILLRLIQRRPWHHRVAGRSLLIGDIPWVAQSLEAFVSKCFCPILLDRLTYRDVGQSLRSPRPSAYT